MQIEMSVGGDVVIFSFAHAAVDDGARLHSALVEAHDHSPTRTARAASMRTVR